jgi:electron transfer flavoprotein beta subunit
MKIVVCIKQTFDTEARITLSDEGRIDDRSVLLIVNPYDEYAVEEAVRLKEKNGGDVTAVTVGGQTARKALQHCLAMGADHAILIDDPYLRDADSHTYALVLSRVIKSMECDLILCGRESIDVGASQVHTRLAELLDLPQVNVVSALSIEDGKAEARRDIEGGTEIIEVDLPAIFSAQKGLNEIRYPPMRRIMLAKKMPIKTFCLADLGLSQEDISPFSIVEEFTFPQPRRAGKLLSGELSEVVSQTVRYLQEDAKVI